ncbi:hypothetical protein [Mesorhizobium sp.]|uniref:hypothetical protein n=1 Tax=Mesorhizobium sp. TaxID=1871066 RepID=UPI000FE88BDA|nr:hypothetical protein [Mesorhizobium sp.]RWP40167.1 MAG: hypothetical protein EOR04_19680 [Mesorhizobium sp.]TIM78524.1 MAG: hypothetical protein E5Y58_02935 [Mesorhizobium sp.]
MAPWQIDNVYVECARLQVKATRTSINLRSTMEESRRILARSQELLRRIHQRKVPPQMPATTFGGKDATIFGVDFDGAERLRIQCFPG